MLGRHKNVVGFVIDQTTHIPRHRGFPTMSYMANRPHYSIQYARILCAIILSS